MDRSDDNLFAALRELRPQPRPEFTAELDQRAAAGFPCRSTPSAATLPFTLLADRWRAMSPTRRLMPVLAVALAAVVVATAVVAISQSGGPTSGQERFMAAQVGGGGAESAIAEPLPAHAAKASPHGPASHHGLASPHGHKAGKQESAEEVYEVEVPTVGSKAKGGSSAGGRAGTVEGEPAEESGGAESEEAGEEVKPSFAPVKPLEESPGHRDIEQSAYIILGTKPGEVSSAAAKVYEAVHTADGIVLHSSVQSGKKGATGAIFELLIPSSKVSNALASISAIAEVRARHDQTNDITEPTVSAAEELADVNASIEGLLKELGNAETEAERESIEARLREERRHHAAIRGSLDHLHARAAMSEVTVRIVTRDGAGVTPPAKGSGSGSWGVGDALHDAGHILTIATGVLLIALAVLAPIALIALLICLASRFRVRRLRERTLG